MVSGVLTLFVIMGSFVIRQTNAQFPYYNGYGGYGGGGWGGYYGGGSYPRGYVRDPRQLQGYEPGYQPGGQTYQGDVAYRAPNWWSQDQQKNAQPITLSWTEKCDDPYRRQLYRYECMDDNGSNSWGRR